MLTSSKLLKGEAAFSNFVSFVIYILSFSVGKWVSDYENWALYYTLSWLKAAIWDHHELGKDEKSRVLSRRRGRDGFWARYWWPSTTAQRAHTAYTRNCFSLRLSTIFGNECFPFISKYSPSPSARSWPFFLQYLITPLLILLLTKAFLRWLRFRYSSYLPVFHWVLGRERNFGRWAVEWDGYWSNCRGIIGWLCPTARPKNIRPVSMGWWKRHLFSQRIS